MSDERVKEAFQIYEMQEKEEADTDTINDEICAESDCCDCFCACMG